MAGKIAGVCLLDNPYYFDGIYDYQIPVEMEESVLPGTFVSVPFGMSNRVALGLVVEIRDRSEYKELKMIRSVRPESLRLDEEMQGLCRFLKQRTLCSTGDAVRNILPSSALTRLTEWYRIAVPTDENELKTAERMVYEYLKAHGESTLETMRKNMDVRAESGTRKLVARGIVTKRTEYREAKEGSTQILWELNLTREAAADLAEGKGTDEKRLTSPKQKSVIAVLLEEDGPMTAADLTGQAGVQPGVLKTLEKNGILVKTEQQVTRNPYSAPFIGRTEQSLNEEQTQALEELTKLSRSGEPKAALLQGVTGSGKTRVMTALIDRLLDDGRGVIVLLPEIALTPQSVAIFCSRYGDRVAVIHSALSVGERYDTYCRIKRGEADVVIGTRSAVFAPVRNLGAVIIDEEQEHTYKSDQNPKYHAKDIARYRCNYHKALMLLASATPSLESAYKAREGIYKNLLMTHRYGNNPLPSVEIVDMRNEMRNGNQSLLSDSLCDAIAQTLASKEQTILFLNRRGYNRTVTCRTCGKPLSCPSCSVAMTYHTRRGSYREGEMVCHWCGKRLPVPEICPACGSEHLAHMGYGTQRVEEELKTIFPSARILRMDTDTVTTKHSYDSLLGKFRNKEADILLGTQMVTKGHDFPDVTLVGVLLADMSLYVDDFRAAEQTFSMLTQVIGRAGRRDRQGRAIIQTNNPDSEVIGLACAQDYDSFYEREIRFRRLLCFPPICDIALLTLSSTSEQALLAASAKLTKEMEETKQAGYKDLELLVFGPFEAPVYRVDNRYRMRMVVKCKLTKQTYAFFAEIMAHFGAGCGKRVTLGVDFNPSGL